MTHDDDPLAGTPAPPAEPGDETSSRAADTSFPIVGVGASAGGLEAFTLLLQHLPADTGMAFVLVQHLEPTHDSYLGALARATRMPVEEAHEGVTVSRDHVYVMPPNTWIALAGGRLQLTPRPDEGSGVNLPIDHFLRSLALERGSQAIGVVLSGDASDGTEGLAAIKAENGITFVQDPRTATFESMPRSAVAAGVVDSSLPIPELAAELSRLSDHPHVAAGSVPTRPVDARALREILALVRNHVGVDFGEWKAPTVERRLARRMALCRVETLAEYLTLLQRNTDEIAALYEDTLIHVTAFFRDPEVFAALEAHAFPEILRNKPDGAPIRVWVAGCSTGEEVYSLAIALVEFLGEAHRSHPVQVFGSDVGDAVIAKARAGVYSEVGVRDLTSEQRRRYFTRVDGGYRINKLIRDLCVFNRHDLARDPPFSKLDLASCRTVLIHFGAALQKRIVPTLHSCLNEPGFLLLGRTESISGFGTLFSVVDKANKIFARSPGRSVLRFAPAADAGVRAVHASAQTAAPSDFPPRSPDVGRQLDRVLLARYAPPGVLINEHMEVLQFRGQTGDFLQPAPGEPQTNLVKMARPGLISALRRGVAEAKKTMAPVRTSEVDVQHDDATRRCDLLVLPWIATPAPREQLFLVLFEPAATPMPERTSPRPRSRPREESVRIARLEHELAATRDDLEMLAQEHGRTSDDLGSTNEELVSGNEELQSMNEALETAKEELQATNEELTTVNEELHSRNDEVHWINNDLVNLLAAVDVPVLILDRERKIRRFTPGAGRILSVVSSDVGRALDDIKLNLRVADLDRQVAEVIETATLRELEVADQEDHWYRLQIRPYRTVENRVDGAVLSLVDIDKLRSLVRDALQARAEAERANLAKDQFLATLSHELRTPLTSMLMHAQLLKRDQVDPAKVKRAGGAIERATLMQVQLIEDLLDVSRIVAGNLRMKHVAVDLGAVVEAALESVVEPALRKSIELVAALSPVRGSVVGDPLRMQQVVTNLLTNAIKFTPSRGTVTIRLSSQGDRAEVQVADTGMGIDPAFLPSIFERFSQADTSNTRSTNGVGLGLSIVHHLVGLHGGTIRAESPGPGKGSIFTVELPLVAADAHLPVGAEAIASREPTSEGARPEPDARPLRGLRILCIDDDPGARDAIAETLRMSRSVVEVAASAAEGMEALTSFKPDVLLCDLAMPNEDGIAFMRRVRSLPPGGGGDVAALALTAQASDENVRAALGAGFQLHLAKPVGIARLTAAIVEVLGMPKTTSASSERAVEH